MIMFWKITKIFQLFSITDIQLQGLKVLIFFANIIKACYQGAHDTNKCEEDFLRIWESLAVVFCSPERQNLFFPPLLKIWSLHWKFNLQWNSPYVVEKGKKPENLPADLLGRSHVNRQFTKANSALAKKTSNKEWKLNALLALLLALKLTGRNDSPSELIYAACYWFKTPAMIH